jgi:putative tricarboxylic transport membrane protein
MSLTKKRSAKGELVFTSFLFVAGVVALWDASQLPESMMADFVGSKTFPSLIGWAMVILSALQLISVARGNVGEPEGIEGGEADSKLHLRPFLMVVAGLLIFALGLPFIGFPLSSAITFTLIVYALNPNKTKWYKVVLIAAAFSATIYLGFVYALQIDLPLGFDFNQTSQEVVTDEEW